MAGLAALLSLGSDRTANETLGKLSGALTPRGSEEARASIGAARLLVRAALPIVSEFHDTIMVVDGIAELSTLAGRFAEHGPAALLTGSEPYALIVADLDGLVLARNGDGPPLYYARSRGAVMVASEPSALLAAGVAANPDEATVHRFLLTGACDETSATFIEGIRRVLPGQVVEVSHTEGRSIRVHPAKPRRTAGVSTRMALLGAMGHDRVAVMLDSGLPGAALLGTALAERKQHRALPVYSANFPGLQASASAYTSTLLSPLPDGALRHRALPFFADELDVDGFLADVGEPMPDLASYLTWATAKATGGEVDALLTSAGLTGRVGHLARLSDRIAARYGVNLCFPYRELRSSPEDGGNILAELRGIAERTLPPPAVRAAAAPANQQVLEPPLAEVLLRLRAELFGALLYPRVGAADHEALADAQQLSGARAGVADQLWRRYLLERWLHTLGAKVPVPAARGAAGGKARAAELVIAGQSWTRQALATEPVVEGDRLAEKIGWYVAEHVNAMDRAGRTALRQPWHLLVAAKPVAVSQGQARFIWQIHPGWLARKLARLGGPASGFADPWSMQVAIEHGGTVRMAAAALCARLGWTGRFEQLASAQLRSISPPRELACPPAHLAVVLPPRDPDEVAEQVRAAVRKALPDDAYDSLAGCVVVGVGDSGTRVLGWSGPSEPPVRLLERLCADNPFGQYDERTPVVMATAGVRRSATPGGRKSGKQPARQPAKRR